MPHLFLVCSCFYYQQFGVRCRHCFAIKSGKLDVFADIHFRWFLGYSDPTHAISALKSSRSFDAATNGPGICGADPDHITTALSSLRKASEFVDAWLRGKLDIIPLSITLWSKYVTAQEYEDVNADFDADHSDATQDRETCHYDFSNSSASASSLKSNFSHYKAFYDERIKEQAGKASRARNQEELQWAIALAAQAHDWLDQELERKFSDSTATESSNQSSERDGNVPRKGGSSKRFVPRGERNKPPASQKSHSNQRQTTTKRKQSSPGEEEKCEQDVLAGSEFDDVQDTPAEPPAPANKKRKISRRVKGYLNPPQGDLNPTCSPSLLLAMGPPYPLSCTISLKITHNKSVRHNKYSDRVHSCNSCSPQFCKFS
eukprot:g38940.t1